MEVKTTRDLTRAHWFSLDQMLIAQLTEVSLASIIAVPARSGLSIADLLEVATDRLTEAPDLAQRVVDIATRTIGDALATSTARFDRRATMRSLRLYPFDEVPQLTTLDDRILELRWRATLANAQAWDEATVQSSRLLRALPAVQNA